MHLAWIYTNRIAWVTRKKRSKGCLFCRIARGDKRIPARILHKDEHLLVVMNEFPYNTGHLIVTPIKHVKNLDELSEEEIAKLFLMVRRCIKLLKKALKPRGFNVGLNIGEFAGASVEHLHVHIVPRFKTDFGFMEIVARTKVMPESLEETCKRLMRYAKILRGE